MVSNISFIIHPDRALTTTQKSTFMLKYMLFQSKINAKTLPSKMAVGGGSNVDGFGRNFFGVIWTPQSNFGLMKSKIRKKVLKMKHPTAE